MRTAAHPRCLGLIGGLGVGATVHYYRRLAKAHALFPDQIRGLPKFDGPFDAFKLQAKGCDVLFASYPAGTTISRHHHETENAGVITQGELPHVERRREPLRRRVLHSGKG